MLEPESPGFFFVSNVVSINLFHFPKFQFFHMKMWIIIIIREVVKNDYHIPCIKDHHSILLININVAYSYYSIYNVQ